MDSLITTPSIQNAETKLSSQFLYSHLRSTSVIEKTASLTEPSTKDYTCEQTLLGKVISSLQMFQRSNFFFKNVLNVGL